MNSYVGMIFVLGCLGGIMLGCKYACQKHRLEPEMSRKLVHVGMGLICACFPLIFDEKWPVYLLSAVSIAALLTLRLVPNLKQTLGSSIHGVKRFSLGELYFPLSVGLLWFIANDKALLFSLSILVLALADATAAIVGTRFGKRQVTTFEGNKSWEGNIAFFVVSSLCIYAPLTYFEIMSQPRIITVSILVAILVMIVEAFAWRGLDNLFIPIASYLMLNHYLTMQIESLFVRILFIVLLLISIFFIRKKLRLDDASLLAICLFLYLSFIIGGWPWGLPAIIFLINYIWIVPRNSKEADRTHSIHAIVAICGPPFFWLMLFYRYNSPELLLPYSLSFISGLSFIHIAHGAFSYPKRQMIIISMIAILVPFMLIIIPTLIVLEELYNVYLISISLVLLIIAAVIFIVWQPEIRNCPIDVKRWTRHGLVVWLASMIFYLV